MLTYKLIYQKKKKSNEDHTSACTIKNIKYITDGTQVYAHAHNAHYKLYWQEKPQEQTAYPTENLIKLQRSHCR